MGIACELVQLTRVESTLASGCSNKSFRKGSSQRVCGLDFSIPFILLLC